MKLDWIRIQGFRNFDNETIKFEDKTLIIGANDVGKSNLIYALRILFDSSLSSNDLELNISDYNVYTRAEEITITVSIKNITEECLLSVFRGNIEGGATIIQYNNSIDGDYSIKTGISENLLQEHNTRFYIKRLNMEYVNSNRDLFSYIRRSKQKLLEVAKEGLDAAKKEEDDAITVGLKEDLDSVNSRIDSLNYLKDSLKIVNDELKDLSTNNDDQQVKFVSSDSSICDLLSNVKMSYFSGEQCMHMGGDGRNNQIFLASWVAKQKLENSLEKVTFFAIEEPEAHLHPHQQVKLSEYIFNSFSEQILITTHSPQIATDFRPNNIVRLYCKNKLTKVAQGGCCKELQIAFDDFGYRLNAITSAVFFASTVILVEGISEVIFYKMASKFYTQYGDLNKNNITILSVDGVGFKPYIKVCKALDIPYIVRTDNDIFTKTVDDVEYKYWAGISRVIGIYKELIATTETDELISYWNNHSNDNEWLASGNVSEPNIELNNYIKDEVVTSNIFISNVDLEEDLINSPLKVLLEAHYVERDLVKLADKMKKRKGENMLDFVASNETELLPLLTGMIEGNCDILAPLKKAYDISLGVVHNDE